MQKTIFREYDIRGLVGTELPFDQLYGLGKAIIAFFKSKQSNIKTIMIGRDGRLSSPTIANQLMQACIDSGCDVIDIGVVPSPVLYFGLNTMPVDAGLIVTASHNPGAYNGIKIMLGTECIWGEDIKTIQEYYENGHIISSEKTGNIIYHNIIPTYIHFLTEQFSALKNMSMPVIFDCANAAASVVMPDLIKAFGWTQAMLLCDSLDGSFPNHQADPTAMHNMLDVRQALASSDAIVGIGFDGDADRMAAMNKEGKLFLGDILLAIFANHLNDQERSKGIVFNVTMSSGLSDLAKQWQCPAYMVPTGHAIVKTKMKEYGALLGGEGSCHFFFKDRYFGYDDGIYAALRLLEIMHMTQQNITELANIFPHKWNSPEYRIACKDDHKRFVVDQIKNELKQSISDTVELITIDGVRAIFNDGWAIVRAANTQPVLSIRFEANDHNALIRIKNQFISMLSKYVSPDILEVMK